MKDKLSIRCMVAIVAVALLCGLGFAQGALAAQAGGSISLIASSPNLVEGQTFNVQVRITNTSSEDLDPPGNGDPIDAVFVSGGAIDVTLACTSTACTTELPGTLEFLSCPSAQTGVTCAANGTNGVDISFANDVVIPAGGSTNVATMSLKAKVPVASLTGEFFQRADTGPNDIAAYSPIEDVTVTGGATGSRNFNFPPVCSVELDKQISCDGGDNWFDVGYDDDVAQACTATDPTLIMVRYLVQNPSGVLSIGGCTLTESNTAFGTPGSVDPLGPGGVDTIPGTLMPACIDAEGGEPNTATVTCTICQDVTVGQSFGDSDQANLVCEPFIGLKVDRNVDCGPAGANNTGGQADELLTEMNGDGTLGCTAFDGDPVEFEYCAKNESSRTLYDCTFVDTSSIVGANGAPVVIGNMAPDAQVCRTSADIPRLQQLCADALETSEALDLGFLGLQCCSVDVDGIINCDEANRVSRYDISKVTCLTPGVELTKTCPDIDGDGRSDKVVLTTENTGEVDLTTCMLTDTLEGFGNIAVVPDEINNLAPEGSVISEGVIPELTADALNEATVNCTAADGSVLQDTASATCTGTPEDEGCLTRTPGFWGTHPHVTSEFLPLDVCGVTLNSVSAGSMTSATEAMCSMGTDKKLLGQQMAQLVRQCTAAALNIAASVDLGGNCDETQGSAGIYDDFAACCGAESICTGDSVYGYNVNKCIYTLDTFNNLPDDTLDFDFDIGSAKPKACQNSKANGIVVTPN